MKPKKEYSDYKKFCEHQLHEDENVITWAVGYIGEMMGSGDKTQINGCLIVTDKRIVFYKKGWFSEALEEIRNDKITAVDSKTILGHTTLTIHAGGNNLKFKSIVKDEVKNTQKAINEQKSFASQKKEQDNLLKDIEKLAELKEKGILTHQEFQSKKEEILKKAA